jgi:hypothetical protein
MAERFWPGATTDGVRTSVAQLQAKCRELARDGVPIRFLGATFVPVDESLSCRFDGTAQAVRAACELAGAVFERLVVIDEMGIEPPRTEGEMS